ncbi:ice-binding protein [Naematelia encephala]|uniref:Ice-binding protein n=1 Tax=Naematelia encephala TaxID=71784 RepID=A0A1Y2ATB4_9TREE|nr:ice-binding protein [Naematelia encephala]
MRFFQASTYAKSLGLLAILSTPAFAATATVNLGTAGNYAVLGESTITNTGDSYIVGNVGLSPAASTLITGFDLVLDSSGQFATSQYVSEHVTAADYKSPTPATLTTAVNDQLTAYNDAAGRTPDDTNEGASGEIGGVTFAPGVHAFNTPVTIASNVILSGSCGDVFIFQIPGTFAQAANTAIVLVGGVTPSTVFWQVAGTLTVGAGAEFQGIALAATQVTLGTGTTVNGRILGQTGVAITDTHIMQPQADTCSSTTVTVTACKSKSPLSSCSGC